MSPGGVTLFGALVFLLLFAAGYVCYYHNGPGTKLAATLHSNAAIASKLPIRQIDELIYFDGRGVGKYWDDLHVIWLGSVDRLATLGLERDLSLCNYFHLDPELYEFIKKLGKVDCAKLVARQILKKSH